MARALRPTAGRGYHFPEGPFQISTGYVLGYSGATKTLVSGFLSCTGASVASNFGLTTIDMAIVSGVSRGSGATVIDVVGAPVGGAQSGATQWAVYVYSGIYGTPNTSACSVSYIAIGTA